MRHDIDRFRRKPLLFEATKLAAIGVSWFRGMLVCGDRLFVLKIDAPAETTDG
jgi:hypothetical protein